jgi:BASS family bile acid:Na+ symporter
LHRDSIACSVNASLAVTGFARTAAILSAIILGALVPQAHVFASAIRWLVMMMCSSFSCKPSCRATILHSSHIALLVANIALGFAAWGAGWLIGGRDIALAAFFCGITPTAIAAPVIISFLGGRVDFVVAAFLLTNICIAALLPLLLPIVLGRATPAAFCAGAGQRGTRGVRPHGGGMGGACTSSQGGRMAGPAA